MNSKQKRMAKAAEKKAQLHRERKEAGLPAIASPMERAAANPTSYRAAINAMCWQCQGENADPFVNWRIGNCVCTDCALWRLRPHQKHQGTPYPERRTHE